MYIFSIGRSLQALAVVAQATIPCGPFMRQLEETLHCCSLGHAACVYCFLAGSGALGAWREKERERETCFAEWFIANTYEYGYESITNWLGVPYDT